MDAASYEALATQLDDVVEYALFAVTASAQGAATYPIRRLQHSEREPAVLLQRLCDGEARVAGTYTSTSKLLATELVERLGAANIVNRAMQRYARLGSPMVAQTV